MNNEKLRQFITLAELRHFGKASDRCCISASTLSRSIRQLEQELGTTLFIRDNRSAELTHQGQKFLSFARHILQQWETLNDEINASNNELNGQISMYCSVTASYSFLYKILTAFRKQHPKIAIKLHTGDPALAIERVNSGLEDIAIAAKLKKMPNGLVFKRITYSRLIFITSKKKAYRSNQNLAATFKDLPLILAESGLAREQLNHWFIQKNIQPTIYAEVGGHEAIVSMVSLGFGVGLVPEIVVQNSPLAKQVMPFSHQPDLTPYEVGFCTLEKRLKSPLVKAFWKQL